MLLEIGGDAPVLPPRSIMLRRPPVLSRVEGPFVPDAPRRALLDADRRWAALCDANPAYHDGRLLHVLGVHRNGHGGATLHVMECAFRYHAVQSPTFDLGVRPLGCKGITSCGGRILLGLRSSRVANYAGQWELAPGGTVEPGEEPGTTCARELTEETGLCAMNDPTPIALLFDDVVRSWEVIFRIDLDAAAAGDERAADHEYDALAWRGLDDLPAPMTPIARRMAALAR